MCIFGLLYFGLRLVQYYGLISCFEYLGNYFSDSPYIFHTTHPEGGGGLMCI